MKTLSFLNSLKILIKMDVTEKIQKSSTFISVVDYFGIKLGVYYYENDEDRPLPHTEYKNISEDLDLNPQSSIHVSFWAAKEKSVRMFKIRPNAELHEIFNRVQNPSKLIFIEE